LDPALEDLANYGIKLAVNAGVTDTKGFYEVVIQMVQKKWLDLKANILSHHRKSLGATYSIDRSCGRLETKFFHCARIVGGWCRISQGLHGVATSRLALQAHLRTIWKHDELDKLANALVAGHHVECSNYVCGGNFTGFKSLGHGSGWGNIGYPIVEISKEGDVIITVQKYASGSAMTVDTCKSQLLYEIQGPWYYNLDATAMLDGIHFEQRGINRAAIHGVQSGPPPPTTKVGITARGGFQARPDSNCGFWGSLPRRVSTALHVVVGGPAAVSRS